MFQIEAVIRVLDKRVYVHSRRYQMNFNCSSKKKLRGKGKVGIDC